MIEVPSPYGIPPWEPPDDRGPFLAHEGWMQWVRIHGNVQQRIEVFSYQLNEACGVIVHAIYPALQELAQTMNRFAQIMGTVPSSPNRGPLPRRVSR